MKRSLCIAAFVATMVMTLLVYIATREPKECSVKLNEAIAANISTLMYEDGPFVEGDIYIDNIKPFNKGYSKQAIKKYVMSRNIVGRKFTLWPKGVVYYEIAEDDFPADYIDEIMTAIRTIEGVSCIMFVEKGQSAIHWVKITGTPGSCYSNIGFLRDVVGRPPQILNLDPTKCKLGNMLHELLHTLGFDHMHSASFRDKYIGICYSNVKDAYLSNFIKCRHCHILEERYDYLSIMHYPITAFSRDPRLRTIVPYYLDDTEMVGQRISLSELDIRKLRKAYKCP